MGDNRRLGHAQRRRAGGSSNMYADVMKPPTHGIGDQVKARGRYGPVTVMGITPNVSHPDSDNDGHGYVVSGGKTHRTSVHLSGELSPFEMGMGELQ